MSRSQCPRCGTELSALALACPGCRALVHAERLKRLVGSADASLAQGDQAGALTAYREALPLLPRESTQFAQLTARAQDLSRQVERSSTAAPSWTKKLPGPLAVVVVIALKLLSGGKLLLLGLLKAPVLLSMLAFARIDSGSEGWQIALGLVLAIYVHEMGHVAALRRFGIDATAPMFVPGLGAFVRLKQTLVSNREDARVGLAGPRWGLFASAAAFGLGAWLHHPTLLTVGRWSAVVNLFNLTPVWTLDGGRGFKALNTTARWGITLLMCVLAAVSGEGMLWLPALGGIYRSMVKDGDEKSDPAVLTEFAAQLILLTAIAVFSGARA